MKVLIAGGGTGGHLMPALAIAQALQDARPDVEPVLIGARRGVEASILPTRPYRFHLLPSEPIYRRQWWRNVRWAVLLPRLVRRCREVLDAERPAFVVGTGGYAAGPILRLAVRRGLGLALQEQNAYPGYTTRRLSPLARQIHLGFPEAEPRLRPGPTTRVFVSGNPIVPPAGRGKADARRALGLGDDRPVLLVTGGSQGSQAINAAVAAALETGALGQVSLLWSTGPATFSSYRSLHRPPQVHVRAFWDPIAEAYAAADVALARAGAMTTAELAAWALPAILVPLPTAAQDHQTANAQALDAAGAGVHLPERRLSELAAVLRSLVADREGRARMAAVLRGRARPHAAREIAERLLELLPRVP